MRSHSKWTTGATILVVLTLGAGQIVPSAFARSEGDSLEDGGSFAHPAETQVQTAQEPSHPFMAQLKIQSRRYFGTAHLVSQPDWAISSAEREKIKPVRISAALRPQTVSSAAATPIRRAPAPQTQKPKKSGVWKWILIGAAAGAGVGVAILATRGEKPTPVVTIGPLVVEEPQ